MNAHRPFLDDIRTSPEEDAPRLIYADWLDDHGDADGAEFIRVSRRAARLGADHPEAVRLRKGREALLQAHWDEWGGPLRVFVPAPPTWEDQHWLLGGFDRRWLMSFHRGFLEALGVTAQTFCDRGAELFDL